MTTVLVSLLCVLVALLVFGFVSWFHSQGLFPWQQMRLRKDEENDDRERDIVMDHFERIESKIPKTYLIPLLGEDSRVFIAGDIDDFDGDEEEFKEFLSSIRPDPRILVMECPGLREGSVAHLHILSMVDDDYIVVGGGVSEPSEGADFLEKGYFETEIGGRKVEVPIFTLAKQRIVAPELFSS